MIERRLLEQAIRRTEIEASDAEVDDAIEASPRRTDRRRELKQSVVRQGLTYEAYREQIRGEIQRQKLVSAAVHSRVRVDEAQIKAAYAKRYAEQPSGGEEVHVRHMLVPFEAERVSRRTRPAPPWSVPARDHGRGRFRLRSAQHLGREPQLGGDVGWVHAQQPRALDGGSPGTA